MSTLDTSGRTASSVSSALPAPRPPAPTGAHRHLAALAIGVTVVLWASAFVAIRHLGDAISPGPLTLGRCLVGSLALGVLLVRRGARPPTSQEWWRLVLLGSSGSALTTSP